MESKKRWIDLEALAIVAKGVEKVLSSPPPDSINPFKMVWHDIDSSRKSPLEQDLSDEFNKAKIKLAKLYVELAKQQIARHRKALGLPREPK